MSILDPVLTPTLSDTRPAEPPPLLAGDRLSRVEFERRYIAHPEIKKAELVEGVVYVPSPVRVRHHARPHALVIAWLGAYEAATPGVMFLAEASLRLDYDNEPQPDALLLLEPAYGGRSRITDDDYIEGAPELIVEIAASSAAYDLHDKLAAYQRNGVREYLVYLAYERRVVWFGLRDGVYQALTPDQDGILKSSVFPGLWLQPAALLVGDTARLLQTLQQGLASLEHAAFVSQLQSRTGQGG
jgi:Uma2 family endonuclease